MRIIRYRNPKTSAYLWHAFKQTAGDSRWEPLCGRAHSHAFRETSHLHPEFDLADNNPPRMTLCPRCIKLFKAL